MVVNKQFLNIHADHLDMNKKQHKAERYANSQSFYFRYGSSLCYNNPMKDGADSRLDLGFTIVELLVVIVVIGILASITIVSYTGIQNKASISSLQSDLANASTILKIDQTTGDNFPTTLALANNGKGITPSQTMDSTIYIPDNTSIPKNFCLMYRKGNNTYAVDNNSSVSNGVCLQNLVTNGDFSNNTSGWTVVYGATSVAGNILSDTGNGTSIDTTIFQDSNIPVAVNKKIYARALLRVTNSNCLLLHVRIQGSTGGGSVAAAQISNPTINTWYSESGIVNIDATQVGNVRIGIRQTYADSSTQNGKTIQVQQVIMVDLTAIFGAGNEPTSAQMDTIMTNYPNSWFNIAAKANL